MGRQSEQIQIVWACYACLNYQHLKIEQTHTKPCIWKWGDAPPCVVCQAQPLPLSFFHVSLLPVGSLVPAVSAFINTVPD